MFWAELFSWAREPELNLALLPNKSSIYFLLLDVEGTTTPVDFVYKKLFPFASGRVETFLQVHSGEVEMQALIADLRREHGPENWDRQSPQAEIASAASYVRQLIAQDRKVMVLKTLQGKIWEEGYRSGELRGEVYEDVPLAFERWKKEGKRIGIFSSGSVLAQKLLFGHSNAGDLTKYIDAYFDTTTGPKREAASYKAIGNVLGATTGSMLFVSDVTQELDAARDAGMYTALMVRPGSSQPSDSQHTCIESFDHLFL